jgi:predicted transcriptional regulator
MNKVEITVGGSLEEDGDAFMQAWRRAEAGEEVNEHRLSFESLEGLISVLTTKRFEILRHVHRQPAPNIRALATELRRDYRNVYDDVAVLTSAGLLSRSGTQVRAEYDVIEARMAL